MNNIAPKIILQGGGIAAIKREEGFDLLLTPSGHHRYDIQRVLEGAAARGTFWPCHIHS